ncbi:MAG: hypothetical protein ACXVH6_02385, partial [Halobacteriota archaeon]
RQGLISGPTRYTEKRRRGQFQDWPPQAVEEAAVVWTLRHLDIDWLLSPPPADMVKRIKYEADAIHKKLKTDATFCRHFVEQSFTPEGKVGYYLKSYDLHPFIQAQIITLEKVKHKRSVREPLKVIFWWRENPLHAVEEEQPEEMFGGVLFEPSDEDCLTVRFRASAESRERILAMMRADLKKYGLKQLLAEEFAEIEKNAICKKE